MGGQTIERRTRLVLAGAVGLAMTMAGCGDSTNEPETPAADSGSTSSPPGTTSAPSDSTGLATTAADTSMSTGEDTGAATFSEPPLVPEYCPPGLPPTLELGHGDVEFRAVDDDIAQIIHGHQGGYHVVLGLRGQGFDLADFGSGHLRATVNGEVVADHTTIVVMNCDDGGEFSEALWINLIFDTEADGLLGQTAHVEATFTDISEQAVTAEADFIFSEDVVHQ